MNSTTISRFLLHNNKYDAADSGGGETTNMSIPDLITCVAYFSIPIQIVISLYRYPSLSVMPTRILILLILFALFIFLCGTGHLFRCMRWDHTDAFHVVNLLTCVISLATAVYLIPLIPNVMSVIDQTLKDAVRTNYEAAASSQANLATFMAFLCHEIRNPLFAITSSAQFLKDDTEMTDDQYVSVGSIYDSSLLMLRLVNDVLDLSKIEAGKLELEERVLDLHRLLQNLKVNMRLQVYQNHGDAVRLRFDVSPSVPRMVLGDSTRILQIVYNLMSNACKFTVRGEIQLSISIAGDEDSENLNDNGEQDAATSNRDPSSTGSSFSGDDDDDDPQAGVRAFSNLVQRITGGIEAPSSRKNYRRAASYSSQEHNRSNSRHDISSSNHNATTVSSSNPTTFIQRMGPPRRKKAHAPLLGAAATKDDDLVHLKIVVADTGVGIDPARITTIFEPYSQAKLSDYRIHGGTGLGLAIISSLLELMGGTIQVSSTVGEGTVFVVHIPIRKVPSSSTTTAVMMMEQPNGTAFTEEALLNGTAFTERTPVYDAVMPIAAAAAAATTTTTRPATNLDSGSNHDRPSHTCLGPLWPSCQPARLNLDDNNSNNNGGNTQYCNGRVVTTPDATGAKVVGVPVPSCPTVPAQAPLFTTPVSIPPPQQQQQQQQQRPIQRKQELQLSPFPSVEPGSRVILVVDDNAVNRKIIARMLDHFHIEYRLACNGQEAVDQIRASRNMTGNPADLQYSLVFMDLCMPVMDGFEAIRTIRREGIIHTPIVALTANALQQERKRAHEAGATLFLTKPILREDLHKVCCQYLTTHVQQQQEQETVAIVESQEKKLHAKTTCNTDDKLQREEWQEDKSDGILLLQSIV